MKLVLVNPLWSLEKPLPLNLTELAGYVRHHSDHGVSIIDLNNELHECLLLDDIMDRAVERVRSQKPDLIGMTCNTVHVPFCVEFCKAYRKKYKTPIVLGGVHPSCDTRRMFSWSGVEYIVRGEGEETLLELLNSIENGSSRQAIRGLSYRRDDKVFHNPEMPLIDDLSKLGFPALDLLLPYVKSGDPASLEKLFYCASRGCPFHCTFCSANRMWKFQRRKPVEHVIKALGYIKDHYKPPVVFFGDDCLSLNRTWFEQLLNEVKKIGIRWGCLSRIDTVAPDLLKKMKESGCGVIYHGLESGSERVRRLLDKGLRPGIDNDAIARLISEESRLGIHATCSFMTGIPTETKTEIKETIALGQDLKQRGADIQFWIMTPYPDTVAVRKYKDRLIKVDRWSRLEQSDVNSYDQFYLYRGFYERYHLFNPDFFMFKPDFGLKDFFALYREGREALLGEQGASYFQGRLYNYFEEKATGTYFIGAETRSRVERQPENAGAAPLFLRMRGDFFKRGARAARNRLVERLAVLKPRRLLLSLAISRKELSGHKKDIRAFLQALEDRSIEFFLTRPLFLNKGPRQTFARRMPRNCAECHELFKKTADGDVVLCTGKMLFKAHNALYRSLNYNFFVRLGIQEPKYGSSCYNFPRDRNAFVDLMIKYNRCSEYLDRAAESLESGSIDKSMAYILKAKRLGYGQERIRVLMGFCLEQKGEFKRAIQELAFAGKIYPQNQKIKAALAHCYSMAGQGRSKP